MKISTLKICGFRCFGDPGEVVNLDHFNCFIGPNASGKTAAMIALGRLFGENSNQRQIISTDFHLKPGEDMKGKPTRRLFIECRIEFPELENNEISHSSAIPEAFNQMIIDEPGGTPYCRIRLDATWTEDGTSAGDIEQSLSWILTPSDDLAVIEDGNRRKVPAGDRAQIRVIYVPATRDPEQQIKITTATAFGRLLASLSWNGADLSLKAKLASLREELKGLTAITTINSQVQIDWSGLYDGPVARDVTFQALEEDPATLLKLLTPTFQPGEDGRTLGTGELSDGLRSLFSLTLALGLFRVEEAIVKDIIENMSATLGFKAEVIEKIPALTIFAVEEAENHLSPHYLGRIMSRLLDVAKSSRAQVVLSSHCPSILSRVEPDQVRYFLGSEQACETKVKTISLPSDKGDEAFKYVREAVQSFPELYFSRLVVLAEGPSEEIVLRRLFKASGAPVDTHFISIVPLGGRHVNHFWRLLQGLEIPFLTLLDLDREKQGAGWGRVQYVRNQLVERLGVGNEKLQFEVSNGESQSLSNAQYEDLHKNSVTNVAEMDAWLKYFSEQFGVFFSTPLDLDFALLEAFPDVYKSLIPPNGGPRLPDPATPEYQLAIKQRMKQVLAADASKATDDLGSTYTQTQQELFAWYKYLFLDGSKPVTHMRALLNISERDLTEKAPDTLRQLIQRVCLLIQPKRK